MTAELLAHAVKARRALMGLTQENVEAGGGPSVATMRTIENAGAEAYRNRTLASLDSALYWARGAAWELISAPEDGPDIPERIARLMGLESEIDNEVIELTRPLEGIKAARLARGWSVEKAAHMAGCAPKTWARAERGFPVRMSSRAGIERLIGDQDESPNPSETAHDGPVLWLADGARWVSLAPDGLLDQLSRRDLLLVKALLDEALHAIEGGDR